MIPWVISLLVPLTIPSIAFSYLWTIDENFQIEYQVDSQEETINIRFVLKNGARGWMGICFHQFMFPADCIIAWQDDNHVSHALDMYNPGIPTLAFFPAPAQDTNPTLIQPNNNGPFNNKDNLFNIMGTNENGILTISFKRKLITQDIFDFQIYPNRQFHVVAAYNRNLVWNAGYNEQQPTHTKIGADVWIIPR